MSRQKTICFFGIYNREYSRNKVLKKGLEENGIKVIECRTGKKGILKYPDLFFKHRRLKNQYDYLLVAFPGQAVVWLAKILTKKKIIFDAFTSLYDSNVFDRQIVEPNSIKAKWYWLLDWQACRLADIIVCDTNEHINFFSDKFGIQKEKFVRVFVFYKIEDITKKNHSNKKLLIHFHGYNIPLQGVETIMQAIRSLESEPNIEFQIVGSRIKKIYQDKGLRNVKFIDNVEFAKLINLINEADVCLGIFGNTHKAKRVIPNKVFEGMALGKPTITADTPAVKELFTDKKDIILTAPSSAEDLKAKILLLKKDNTLRNMLSNNAQSIAKGKLRIKSIIKPLIERL